MMAELLYCQSRKQFAYQAAMIGKAYLVVGLCPTHNCVEDAVLECIDLEDGLQAHTEPWYVCFS